eukprot:4086065-Pyramimonas_sp.AAC.1
MDTFCTSRFTVTIGVMDLNEISLSCVSLSSRSSSSCISDIPMSGSSPFSASSVVWIPSPMAQILTFALFEHSVQFPHDFVAVKAAPRYRRLSRCD